MAVLHARHNGQKNIRVSSVFDSFEQSVRPSRLETGSTLKEKAATKGGKIFSGFQTTQTTIKKNKISPSIFLKEVW